MDDTIASPSRRGFLTGLAGTGLVAIGGVSVTMPAQAAGAGFGTGPLSGLPWHSGCGLSKISAFEAYRGRKADTYTIWCPHRTWSDIVSLKGGFTVVKGMPGRLSMAIAPLPASHSAVTNPGNWKLAAKGSFDGYYTQFSRKLADSGRKDCVVRIGWEINHTFPWFGGSDPEGFKSTFKRIADILRKYNPTVSTEWTCVKRGKQSGSVLTLYPGDDAVDIVGVGYYDGYPANNTEAIWNQHYKTTYKGGPWGIGAWLDFAKSRGKKLACPEWGISAGKAPGGFDNPLYIRKMHEFFSSNRAYIAYENYFNQVATRQLTPSDRNPKASAEYKRLWGR